MLTRLLEFEPAISTHKMNPLFRPPRIDTEVVAEVVRRNVVAGDIPGALAELKRIPAVARHIARKDDAQQRVFETCVGR